MDGGDGASYSLSGAEDVDGDGRDDVIVGATFAHGGPWPLDKGAAYVGTGAGVARPETGLLTERAPPPLCHRVGRGDL